MKWDIYQDIFFYVFKYIERCKMNKVVFQGLCLLLNDAWEIKMLNFIKQQRGCLCSPDQDIKKMNHYESYNAREKVISTGKM